LYITVNVVKFSHSSKINFLKNSECDPVFEKILWPNSIYAYDNINGLFKFWYWLFRAKSVTKITTCVCTQRKKYMCTILRTIIFLWDRRLNSGIFTFKAGTQLLEPCSNPFCSDYIGDGITRTICLGWSWPSILPLSAP
jgi:hypothetical protein